MVTTPGDDSQFQILPVFKSATAEQDKPFGIMLDPAPKDGIGRGIICGLAPAQVSIGSADHGFARIGSGATLESAASGYARIVWKAGDSGSQWCLLCLPAGKEVADSEVADPATRSTEHAADGSARLFGIGNVADNETLSGFTDMVAADPATGKLTAKTAADQYYLVTAVISSGKTRIAYMPLAEGSEPGEPEPPEPPAPAEPPAPSDPCNDKAAPGGGGEHDPTRDPTNRVFPALMGRLDPFSGQAGPGTYGGADQHPEHPAGNPCP